MHFSQQSSDLLERPESNDLRQQRGLFRFLYVPSHGHQMWLPGVDKARAKLNVAGRGIANSAEYCSAGANHVEGIAQNAFREATNPHARHHVKACSTRPPCDHASHAHDNAILTMPKRLWLKAEWFPAEHAVNAILYVGLRCERGAISFTVNRR